MRATASATCSGSSASSASGRLVSMRQKPHALVQRSPLIMNVAVPSAQHSNMFGQPASSQTVTRESSRIVERSLTISGPIRACALAHSGLRAEMDTPWAGSTPASTSRRSSALPARGAPSVTAAGEPELGRTGPGHHDESCRSITAPGASPGARRTIASTASLMVTFRPSAAIEVTPRSVSPQGTMLPNIERSGSTFRANPCIDRPRLILTPTAQIFRGAGPSASIHTPG